MMDMDKLKLITRRVLSPFPILVLVALGCLPVAARADSFTLDGASIDSFSFDTAAKTFSVRMDTADALQYRTDVMLGTKIADLTLDEFALVGGMQTLEDEIDFREDLAKSFQFVTGTDMQTVNVTFSYREVKVTEAGSGGSGGGNGTPMPEPSSVVLLASGVLGLIGFGRKKCAVPRVGGYPGSI